ncbi:MAG: hypothetical protein ACKVU4_07805 [Phycisphaerales bacterium]
MGDDRAYLSVLRWPDGSAEDGRAAALVEAMGMDVYTARLAARRGVPQVVLTLASDQAAAGVARLRAMGVLAIAPSRAGMEASGPARRVKRLIPAMGAPMYQCEMWRGEPEALRMEDVALLVHAEARERESRTTRNPDRSRAVMGGLMAAGAAGAMIGGALAGPASLSTRRTTITCLLDMFLRDGRRLRIDSEKFGFDVLGAARGVTDRESMAVLVKRFTREAPAVRLDQGFGSFVCPAEFVRSHFSAAGGDRVNRTSEASGFDFYGAWVWAVFRAGGAATPAPAPAAARPVKRWAEGVCIACGYDMSGTPNAERCPECGTTWSMNAML